MILLLDTQAFLWFVTNDRRLSAKTSQLIQDGGNQRLLSTASLWEMAIKFSLNRLTLAGPFDRFISEQLKQNQIMILPITMAHIGHVSAMPFHHRDPFDRMLAAQALIENIRLISNDEALDAYGISRDW